MDQLDQPKKAANHDNNSEAVSGFEPEKVWFYDE